MGYTCKGMFGVSARGSFARLLLWDAEDLFNKFESVLGAAVVCPGCGPRRPEEPEVQQSLVSRTIMVDSNMTVMATYCYVALNGRDLSLYACPLEKTSPPRASHYPWVSMVVPGEGYEVPQGWEGSMPSA